MSYQVSKIFSPAQQAYGRTCLLHTFQGQPKKTLEQFWLQLAEGSSRTSNFPFTEWPFSDLGRSPTTTPMEHSVVTHISQVKSLISFYTSAMHGNNRVFMPRWGLEYLLTDPESFRPDKWTYLYDHLYYSERLLPILTERD